MTEATLRLPGSVAEVEASGEGPAVAAFFDLDGTLIAGYSARVLTQDRLRRNQVNAAEVVRTVGLGVSYGLGRAGFADLLGHGAQLWEGRSHDDLVEMGRRLFEQKISDLIYPEVRELVRAHQRRGHTVVLASSATTYQVAPVARYLGIDRVLCNRFTVDGGVLTGDVDEPVLWGPAKADAVQQLAAGEGIDLRDCYFYADGDEDEALMHLVGHPRPTNPSPGLTRVAGRRGWPVLRFASRRQAGPVSRLRTLAGLGAIVPAGAAGVVTGLVRRDKRAGVNMAGELWLPTLLAANGVRLQVVGRPNLVAERPAVFVFNHRNNFDPFIAASLVRRDFVAVAKAELAGDPILGPIGRLVGMAFVDRDNPRAALATLRQIEQQAAEGLSILVAPEGTRYDTDEVGDFKKGAFRIAVAARLPVVPIVIRNAELIGGRNAGAMNPGTVDVAVLPPISTTSWSRRGLEQRVAQVRDQFLAVLRDWPEDDDDLDRFG